MWLERLEIWLERLGTWLERLGSRLESLGAMHYTVRKAWSLKLYDAKLEANLSNHINQVPSPSLSNRIMPSSETFEPSSEPFEPSSEPFEPHDT